MKGLLLLAIGLFLAASVTPALAAEVAGTWRITISTPDETITGMGVLKQSGKAVTGWVGPDEDNPIPVEGTLDKNTLTRRTMPRPGRTVAFDRCHVTISGDKMTGKIEREGWVKQGLSNSCGQRRNKRRTSNGGFANRILSIHIQNASQNVQLNSLIKRQSEAKKAQRGFHSVALARRSG
jgi:hypothetical protein